jgi:hypothetical protein
MQPASIHGTEGEKMTYKKYREEELQEYLLSHAEIRAFYITCLDNSSSGLISYFDSKGKAWRLMEDNDDLVADAVEFLKNHGAPLFEDINAVQEFESRWGK